MEHGGLGGGDGEFPGAGPIADVVNRGLESNPPSLGGDLSEYLRVVCVSAMVSSGGDDELQVGRVQKVQKRTYDRTLTDARWSGEPAGA